MATAATSIPTPPEETPRALRSLSDDAFRALYDCDRFTATVLGNRLRYTVQHMSTGLMYNAFSPIIRDWYDFGITVSGPPDLGYPMSAVSASLVVFLGTMGDAVRNAVEEYGVERLRPGDVLLCNDPYRVGNHVNDVCFIRPVFHRGTLAGFVNVRAHQLDMGGVTPGGFSGTKRNVYENGLVLAPMLLYQNDQPVPATHSLIFDNTRLAPLLRPDFVSTFRQLQLGERLISESIDRYGMEAYRGTLRYLCDASAETMRDALSRLPDGEYDAEGGIDADGAGADEDYVVRAKIVKRGTNVEVDLSGTSRQARTCINAGPLDAKTSIAVAFKLMLDPNTPFTSGAFRDIDIVVPPGTILSGMPPDGAIMLYWEVAHSLLMAVFRTLGRALGRDAIGGDYGSVNAHNAHGFWPDGRPWANIGNCGGEHGPWGATSKNDGDSYSVTYQLNNIDPPTEAVEQDSPVVMLRKEYAVDSGGAGYNRGGAGVIKDTLWRTPAEHYSMPLQTRRASGFGAYGGADGRQGGAWLFEAADPGLANPGWMIPLTDDAYRESTPIAGVLDPRTKALDPNGRYFYFAREPVWRTKTGAGSRYVTNGGGGWGDPLTREPERVLRDVRNGYVSIAGARRDYGVVIEGDPERDPEGLRIDEEATRTCRGGVAGTRDRR